MIEHRTSERYNFSQPAIITSSRGNNRATIKNISIGGFCIYTKYPILKGNTVILECLLPTKTNLSKFSTNCFVLSTKRSKEDENYYYMNLQFVNIQQPFIKVLAEFIILERNKLTNKSI